MCARTVERLSSSAWPAATALGSRSFAPSRTRFSDSMSLAFATARTVVLCFAAIAASVSPGLTTYVIVEPIVGAEEVRAGDPVGAEPTGALEAEQGGAGGRAEVAVDVEQPQMPGAREQELKRGDVPAVCALPEHPPRDERPAERAEPGARSRSQLPRHRQSGRALERTESLRGHRACEAVDPA